MITIVGTMFSNMDRRCNFMVIKKLDKNYSLGFLAEKVEKNLSFSNFGHYYSSKTPFTLHETL